MVYVHRRLFKTLKFHETKITQNPTLKPFVIFTFSPHLKRNTIAASDTELHVGTALATFWSY